MPLPDVAGELGLGVDLVLVEVARLPPQLHQRLDQARVTTEKVESLMQPVAGEGGAGRAVLFQIDLVALQLEHLVRGAFQRIHFLFREIVRNENPAFVTELGELFVIKLQRSLPWFGKIFLPEARAAKKRKVDAPHSAASFAPSARP